LPTLDTHPSISRISLLNLGESGTGKSGALASLVIAGYRLWILDFDNGVDIIVAALRDHYKSDPAGLTAALRRVTFETIRDEVSLTSGVAKIKSATAWKRTGEIVKSWETEKFTAKDIVVVDTLTTMSEVAFNHALSVNGRLNQRPHDTDYGWMADSVLMFIDALADPDAKYNLIINTHIRYLAGEEVVAPNDRNVMQAAGQLRGLPNAKGQVIPRNIGKYVNTVVMMKTLGSGGSARRTIVTEPQGVVEVKTSNPFGVKKSYDVKTGMAELFADILGTPPPSQAVPLPEQTAVTA
jgi:hypothetical protein